MTKHGQLFSQKFIKTNGQLRTFKCIPERCKACPFSHNAETKSGPKWYIKITDHFTYNSPNVFYYITCTYCKTIYIGETGRQLGDRFQETCTMYKGMTDKPVARHFDLPTHYRQPMAVCCLSLYLGSSESLKTLEQKFIFQIGTCNLCSINKHFSF